MPREMRRKDRQASLEEAIKLLEQGEYGILGTSDGQNSPYVVPLSYTYTDGFLYFHCALEGHKLENIKANPKVSFCVVGKTKVLPDQFSTDYESAVAFGTAVIVEQKEEKVHALRALISKYSPEFKVSGDEYINRACDATCVVKIKVEHISGKKRAE